MDTTKYTVSILNSKWHEMKKNIEMYIIPRKDEYIYMDDQYWEVLNVVHMLNEKHQIFIIVTEMNKKVEHQPIENQEDKK